MMWFGVINQAFFDDGDEELGQEGVHFERLPVASVGWVFRRVHVGRCWFG